MSYSSLCSPHYFPYFWDEWTLVHWSSGLHPWGVPSLQYLMPDELRWSRCNKNRSKVHNTCNVFKPFWNHPNPHSPTWSVEKLSSIKLVPGANKVGDCCLEEAGFARPTFYLTPVCVSVLTEHVNDTSCFLQRKTQAPQHGHLSLIMSLSMFLGWPPSSQWLVK